MAASKKQAVADVGQRDDRLESLSHPKNLTDLYEHDYYAWVQDQVRALREHRIEEVDWENVAEEIDDLGKSVR